jgi:hypothetical protein
MCFAAHETLHLPLYDASRESMGDYFSRFCFFLVSDIDSANLDYFHTGVLSHKFQSPECQADFISTVRGNNEMVKDVQRSIA